MKTTLIKILLGIVKPTSDQSFHRKDCAVGISHGLPFGYTRGRRCLLFQRHQRSVHLRGDSPQRRYQERGHQGIVRIRSRRQRRRVGVDSWPVSSFGIWVRCWFAPFGIWFWVGQRIHNAWAVDRRWSAECRWVVPDEGSLGEQRRRRWCQTKQQSARRQ